MVWLRRFFVCIILLATFSFAWWEANYSTGVKEAQWFQNKIDKLAKENQELIKKNLRIKQKIVALRYDHRVIEQEARKQLSFSRQGEITLIVRP